MRCMAIIILILLSPLCCVASDTQKIITKDFGIIGKKFVTVPLTKAKLFSEVYWQCFPRNRVSIDLVTMTDFDDIDFNDEIRALVEINVKNNNGEYHTYSMRRALAADDYLKRVTDWLILMKAKKYVCIAGRYFGQDKDASNSNKHKVHLWVFEKIRSKKGCDSYFVDKDCQFKS